MNIFFEESGRFKVAAVSQKNEAHYLATSEHNKKIKVKTNHVFFEFDQDASAFLVSAQSLSEEIDIPLLWEVCSDEELSVETIAEDYFGHVPSKMELAASLMALYSAPMYFYKKGRGRFKRAPEDILKQALATIEKKKAEEAKMNAWILELQALSVPEAIQEDIKRILHAPDKQSLTYKAFTRCADGMKVSVFELAQQLGLVSSLHQYLLDGFEVQHYPEGPILPSVDIPSLTDLPHAPEGLRAFSIDDSHTTEIDDAISIQDLEDGAKRVGIHIAVPAMAIESGSLIEKMIFKRQSTAYFPTGKIMMLPENWVQAFSLDEGDYRAALSIYFDVAASGDFVFSHHGLERVFIENNLRIEQIEPFFNRTTGVEDYTVNRFAHHDALVYLYQWGIQLQKKRGKYEENPPARYDYSVEVSEDETVSIVTRERGSPIDTVVSEMMLLANSTWAAVLDEHEIGGLFRTQAPMSKVRMSTKSEPHAGIGVAHYAWFTSPLRRAVDYVNQRQLLFLIDENIALRFEANDIALFAELRDFESTYAIYGDFQQSLERYWSLVYLKQNDIKEINAMVLKEDLVRLEGLPMVARVRGIPVDVLPKTRIKANVTDLDVSTQSLSLQYVNVLLSESI